MIITEWSETTADNINEYWSRIIDFVPNILGAIIIVVIGFIIAAVLKWAVVTILESLKLQSLFDRIHVTDLLKKAGMTLKSEEASGQFVKWLTIIIFLIPAAQTLKLDAIKDLLERLLQFIPNVVISLLIIMIGAIIANALSQIVKAAAASIGANTAKILGAITRYVIYIFIAFAAFFQLGVPYYYISVMFTGLVAAIAISVGLAFGLGGQTGAADLVKKLREDFKK